MLKIEDYSGFILASNSLPLYLSHSCVMTHTAYSKQKAVSIFSLIAWGCWDGGWASERWDKAMKLPSRQQFFFFPPSELIRQRSQGTDMTMDEKTQTYKKMCREKEGTRRETTGGKGRNRASFCVMLYMDYFQAASILKSSNISLTSADMAPSSWAPTLCQPDDLLAKLSNEVVPFFYFFVRRFSHHTW